MEKSVSPKNSDEDKLQVAKSKERDVCINIGLLEWNIKESILKPKRGKKLVLRVSNKANYKTVCSQAVEKWKAFYSHLYSESDDYVLLYENGEEALFLPGSTKEFFSLERYQEELGKDYNRITLFLCTSFDYNISQGIDSDNDDALLNCDIPDDHGTSIEPHVHPTPKRLKVDVAENNKQKDFQVQNDEKFAIELQQQFEEEVASEINTELPLSIAYFHLRLVLKFPTSPYKSMCNFPLHSPTFPYKYRISPVILNYHQRYRCFRFLI
jgi:hypothetical protein